MRKAIICALLASMPIMAQVPAQAPKAPAALQEQAKVAQITAALEERKARTELVAKIEENPRTYLQRAGDARGLTQSQINQLDRVMSCESQYCDPYWLQNKTSSAAGCFQIVKGTWQAYSDYQWADRYDNAKNIDTALNIYQQSGIHHWNQCL